MERVAFLIEETNEQIRCLLNPESLHIQRLAGIRTRRSISGQVTGSELSDDPLFYTGGGRVEIHLNLLFDVTIAGSSIATNNVRELTAPFWSLAENIHKAGYGRPPQIRFLWGKSWDIPGVVLAVSERLEQFAADGTPRRSWMSMRILRVNERIRQAAVVGPTPLPADLSTTALASVPEHSVQVHEILGGGPVPAATGSADASDTTLSARTTGAGAPIASPLDVDMPAASVLGKSVEVATQPEPSESAEMSSLSGQMPVGNVQESTAESSLERGQPAVNAPAADAPAASVLGKSVEVATQPEPSESAEMSSPSSQTPAGNVQEAAAESSLERGQQTVSPADESIVAQQEAVAPLIIGERLDQIAYRYYGDPRYWRLLAVFNHIDDPFRILPGQLLRIPPAAAIQVK